MVETDTRLSGAAQLQAEADAAIAAAPPEAAPALPAPAGPDPAAIEAGYAMLTGAVLDAACSATCPAWEITAQEKGKLAGALAHACALWFPAEIPEKYVALLVVAGVGFEIVSARRDPATGLLKPRFHAPPEQTNTNETAPAVAH